MTTGTGNVDKEGNKKPEIETTNSLDEYTIKKKP